MEQNYLEVHGLRKKFGNTEVLRGIDFSLGIAYHGDINHDRF